MILIISNEEIKIMDMKNVQLDEKLLKKISETYKILNISDKDRKKDDEQYEIFRYDFSKRSSLDINTYAKV